MVKKININFGNKTFYLLLGVLAVAILAGVSYAWQSGNPSVMGHTDDEISVNDAGTLVPLKTYISNEILREISGVGEITCPPAYLASTKSTFGKAAVDLTSASDCYTDTGCILQQKIYSSTGTPKSIRKLRFSQIGTYWSTGTASGTNGDTTETDTIPAKFYQYLRDDRKGVEASSTQIYAFRSRGSDYQEIYLCTEN